VHEYLLGVCCLDHKCSDLEPCVDEEIGIGLFTMRITGACIKVSDRFELMRLFVRIAEAGSLSAAAYSLKLSQPSASRQLKHLESLLGTQLIQRSTHEMTLTDAGSRFLDDAKSLLGHWENVAETLRLERNELRGLIKAAAPVAIGQTLLARIASQFLLQHPAVSIDWRLSDEPVDLIAGGYDLWIRAGEVSDPGLIVKDLWRIERSIVAVAGSTPATDPNALESRPAVQVVTYVSREVPLVGPKKQTETLRLRPVFTTDNVNAAIVAVREGVGYGILPLWAVQDDLDAGRMIHVCPEWLPPFLKLSVAYPPGRYRPIRVNAFIRHLRSDIPKTGPGIVAIGG
jgi:DNA-binding transcriptional LysR family regulator